MKFKPLKGMLKSKKDPGGTSGEPVASDAATIIMPPTSTSAPPAPLPALQDAAPLATTASSSGSSSTLTGTLQEPLLPPPAPLSTGTSQEAGDDFGSQQGTLQQQEAGTIPEKLSVLLDAAIDIVQQLLGVGGYTMAQDFLRLSMLVQVFVAVTFTYLLATLHIWAILGVPIMIAAIWLIWTVHLKSVTSLIKTSTRLDFILSGLMPEKESAWWLNMVVRACWPIFLRDFLGRVVVPKLGPWFLNRFKPPMLLGVDVLEVDMGERGPVVSNIRVLENVTGDSHVELEMDLEVASADDMFIKCGAKAVGMSAVTWVAYVTGMHLTGTIRASLKFSTRPPFVDRVSVMFPTPPQLSCAIKVLGGLDAASMPLLAGYVEATLQAALNASLCWPNRIIIVDAVKAVAHLLDLPLPEESDVPTPGTQGSKAVKLTRALAGPKAATAVVEVVEGEDLLAADTGGTSDPYVKGSLGPARFTTGVIFKTLFPKWVGERYELPVADWLNEESYMLRLKVRDYDTFSSDDDLGFCDIDLRPLRGGLTQNVWQDLQGVETGSIHVQITIKDDVGLSAEERQQLLEAKKAEETLRAKRLAGLVRNVDAGAVETVAGMLGSLEAFDPKSAADLAGSMVMRNYTRTAEALVSKNLLPKALLGGEMAAVVKVEVVEGSNLIVADKGGTSDPYVKGFLGRSKFSTQVIYKNLNPKWLESHRLSLKKWPEPGQKCMARFEVWDRDRAMQDDFMGKVEVDISRFRNGAENELVLPLQGVASGTIRLIIQVIDLEAAADDAPEPGPPPAASKPGNGASEAKKELAEAKWKGPAASGPAGTALGRPMDDYAQMGVLTANKTPAGISTIPITEVSVGPAEAPARSFIKIEIIEAEDLEPKDGDTSDPFVKGTIGSVQFSTKHINKTLNPKWFDAFKLPIVQWRPDSTSLTIEVFDKNAVAANVSIGRCILDLNRFRDGMRHDLWLRLENAKCGKIHVAITDLDDTLEIKSDIVEVIPGVLIESWRVQSELLKGRAISA